MAIITRESKGAALTHSEMDNNIVELRDIPNGKVYPKESGTGIKIDTASPDYGWHDLIGNLHVYNEVGDATRTVYRGGIKALQFVENESAYIDFHIPHDYAVGTPIYIHAHWSHNSTLVTGGSCTFGFELMYAKGHDQDVFNTPVNVSVVQNASTQQYRHMVAETMASDNGGSAVSLDTNLLEVDGIFQCRVYLDSNDITSSGAVPNPFIHSVDIHYQSTGLATKNKAPNFYGV